MATQITGACGAVYQRTEIKFTVRHNDSANCQVCGKELESWNGSRVPRFWLIKRPETATD